MRLPILALFCIAAIHAAAGAQQHTFVDGEYIITMKVQFLAPYVGKRLVFYNSAGPHQEICAVRVGKSETCPERFVGAVATVIFSVKRAGGTVPRNTSIREYVTVTAESPGLPPRLPFEKTQALEGGVITDLQVFGYEESPVANERTAAPKQSQERLWRLYRQELYLNDGKKPFAIIQWRHALDRIEILDVQPR
jgi:hypothetical protein